MGLSVVRDIRGERDPADPEDLAAFETDVLAGYVLARASSGLADTSLRSEIGILEQVRTWFGHPLWEMRPEDADAYFGGALRSAAPATRRGKAFALTMYFRFLELRVKQQLYQLTGLVVECPLDEMNTPGGRHDMRLRVPPEEHQVAALFGGWRTDLVACRKFAPAARNYTASRLMALVGLRINETRMLDLADVRWELGRFGKLHVRHGKGARRSGPRERMVPMINGAEALLRWYVEEVWGHFDHNDDRPGAPLFPSERRGADNSSLRVGDHALRNGLAEVAERHMPDWDAKVTPHVLRHYCASHLYLAGMDLLAIQELLGHEGSPRRCATCTSTRASSKTLGRPASNAPPDDLTDSSREEAPTVKWNLRLTAANRGIWKASELHRLLAEHGLVISAGKMSGLWSGDPASIKLTDLDVICAVLGCGVDELLVPEPDKVPRPGSADAPAAASSQGSAAPVRPRRRDGRSVPPL